MKKLLYFTAEWCGPCKQLGPIMDELKSEGYNIQKIDVDISHEMSRHYGVRNVPTAIMLNATGEEKGRKIGFNPKNSYIELYNKG